MITIGLSSHRIEALPFIREQMGRHKRIVLESEPSPFLAGMLCGDVSIGDYILGLESEFPEFERRLCFHLRELHRAGKRIVQVEPYLERLLTVHRLFEVGRTPNDILEDGELREIYLAEKRATGALITYYARSKNAPFDEVVAAVKSFAHADARRLTLRDKLRARAVASLVQPGEKTYVEAGYIHHRLCHFLRRELDRREVVLVVNLLAPLFEKFGGKKGNLGPGDRLTLYYTSIKKPNEDLMNLLAARSLIHIKLVSKEELLPGDASHIEDEVRANRLVDKLQFQGCCELFEQIRDEPCERALELVQAHKSSA